MENLEDLIKNNLDEFNDIEPNGGHFDRFEKKLKKQRQIKAHFTIGNIVKVAAIAVFLVLSGIWIYSQGKLSVMLKSEYALSDVSQEYMEVEYYYTSLVNEKYTELNQFSFSDSTQKQILINELDAMDKMYESMKVDLKDNPNDQRIINAMIQHYQTKVEVMNGIISQLEEVNNLKNKKNKNHESTQI